MQTSMPWHFSCLQPIRFVCWAMLHLYILSFVKKYPYPICGVYREQLARKFYSTIIHATLFCLLMGSVQKGLIFNSLHVLQNCYMLRALVTRHLRQRVRPWSNCLSIKDFIRMLSNPSQIWKRNAVSAFVIYFMVTLVISGVFNTFVPKRKLRH